MPSGELKINGQDAYNEWGISLSDGSLAALMTPPAMKERARNSSRLRHGEEIVGSVERVASREIALSMHLTAPNATIGLQRYYSFCNSVLTSGTVNIRYSLIPNKEFKCKYISCSNFTDFRNELMTFTLKLDEPDPANREPEND